MKKIFLIAISLIIVFLLGCSQKLIDKNIPSDNEKVAEEFIKSKGYEIIEFKDKLAEYTLEKSKIVGGIEAIPYQQIWGVQQLEPDIYFGKEIETYEFIVKNHPLEKNDENVDNGVKLYIMISDNKVIGGYSYPNADVTGSFSSLEGKTIEEVTGLTFQEWLEKWENKYS